MQKILLTFLFALAVVSAYDDSDGACAEKKLQFVKHPKNCQAYYSCVKNVGTERHCDEGFYFDEKNQWCDKKENVKCEQPGPPAPSKCDPNKEIYYLAIEGECNQYILCVQGVAHKRKCAPGLWFDGTKESCDLEENVDCNACPFKDDPSKPMHLPNKVDCNKYFICMDRERVPFTCSQGLHFSEETNQCMEPEEAECRFIENSTEIPSTVKP